MFPPLCHWPTTTWTYSWRRRVQDVFSRWALCCWLDCSRLIISLFIYLFIFLLIWVIVHRLLVKLALLQTCFLIVILPSSFCAWSFSTRLIQLCYFQSCLLLASFLMTSRYSSILILVAFDKNDLQVVGDVMNKYSILKPQLEKSGMLDLLPMQPSCSAFSDFLFIF